MLVSLPDGRVFPSVDGVKPLPWSLASTYSDEQAGYPEARAIIRAMREHRPDQLRREHRDLLRSSFGLFGKNAAKMVELIEEETPALRA